MRELFGPRFSPEIELTTLASGMGSGVDEHYSGWDGLIQYLTEWLEPFSEYQIENLDYIVAGVRPRPEQAVGHRQWQRGPGRDRAHHPL